MPRDSKWTTYKTEKLQELAQKIDGTVNVPEFAERHPESALKSWRKQLSEIQAELRRRGSISAG